MTGLWNSKDIQNSRQNCSKNKLVRENAVTRARGCYFNITEAGLELIFLVLEGGYCLSFC